MRSPWIDLLFLHGYATPTHLAWRSDTPAGERPWPSQIEVDVAQLPLCDRCESGSGTCCA